MSEFNLGVVIPVGAGREENVNLMLRYLSVAPLVQAVILVLDGVDVAPPHIPAMVDGAPTYTITSVKHRPGMEQPRNLGVRHLFHKHPQLTHVWFLDTDILIDVLASTHYAKAAEGNGMDSILIGPYEWMPPGQRARMPGLFNDPRWEMFNERKGERLIGELGVALGNFSGNLVWPIKQFIDVGGFHPMLHHGRCEDGELGLRAGSYQVPMTLVPEARGWHVWHPVNAELVNQRNARDVPLLNHWHPWVEQKGLIVTQQDGARFDYECECGLVINSGEMWSHTATHAGTRGFSGRKIEPVVLDTGDPLP